jgi:3-hydroxyisobutyrate/3-hydroxypropionate dehydrogenase
VIGVSPGAPVEREYDGGFGVRLMKKDLQLALEAAESVDAKFVLGEEISKVYEAVAADKELGGKDFSVVYKWLQ